MTQFDMEKLTFCEGIMDETGFLQESEIFCFVQKEDGGMYIFQSARLICTMRSESPGMS